MRFIAVWKLNEFRDMSTYLIWDWDWEMAMIAIPIILVICFSKCLRGQMEEKDMLFTHKLFGILF
jgi:hypothetical protein